MPEGVTADPEVLKEFGAVAKGLNLPQAEAQKLVDLQAKVAINQQQKVSEHFADIGGMPNTWEAQSRADKEFGGDKFEENLALAAKARDRFGTPLLTKVLAKTGAGNHPEVLRLFLRVGKAISEDTFVPGGGGTGRKPDTEVFYGTPKT